MHVHVNAVLVVLKTGQKSSFGRFAREGDITKGRSKSPCSVDELN